MISVLRKLKSLAGAELTAYTVTNAALTASESFAPGGMDMVGILIAAGSTATGTTPTITAALECSPDNGSNWFAVPYEDGASTASASAAASTTTNVSFFCRVPLSETGESSNPLLRWVFTYNNADNDFEALDCWLAMRKYNQRHP